MSYSVRCCFDRHVRARWLILQDRRRRSTQRGLIVRLASNVNYEWQPVGRSELHLVTVRAPSRDSDYTYGPLGNHRLAWCSGVADWVNGFPLHYSISAAGSIARSLRSWYSRSAAGLKLGCIIYVFLARTLQALSDPYYQSTCLPVCLCVGNFDGKYFGN